MISYVVLFKYQIKSNISTELQKFYQSTIAQSTKYMIILEKHEDRVTATCYQLPSSFHSAFLKADLQGNWQPMLIQLY